MQKPLITIITVTFNAAGVIEKTMKSLKEQTFKDFEHLVIDGASTDSTLPLINQCALHQTRILSEPDKGLYDAMNKGLNLAKGEFILYLNAGDAFHSPVTLLHYYEKALEGKDIIYGDTIIVDKAGNKISDRHLKAPECLSPKSFAKGMTICHQAFMVKKDLTCPYDLSYKFSADYDWCAKAIKKADSSKCVNLNEIVIDYLDNGLTDNNKKKSLKERFEIMRKHYGLPLTLFNHFTFIFRALKRGKI